MWTLNYNYGELAVNRRFPASNNADIMGAHFLAFDNSYIMAYRFLTLTWWGLPLAGFRENVFHFTASWLSRTCLSLYRFLAFENP